MRYTGELQAEVATVTDKYESAIAEVKKVSSALASREMEITRLNGRIREVIILDFLLDFNNFDVNRPYLLTFVIFCFRFLSQEIVS